MLLRKLSLARSVDNNSNHEEYAVTLRSSIVKWYVQIVQPLMDSFSRVLKQLVTCSGHGDVVILCISHHLW